MALKKIDFQTDVPIHALGCDVVALCLTTSPWSERTVTGLPFIYAVVENTGRYLGGYSVPRYENPRREDDYQYTFTYDDAQLEDDQETGEPYVVGCEDIRSVLNGCVAEALLALHVRIDALENPV